MRTDDTPAAAASGTLKDTVALVTGASSGVGAATARRLAADGAAVVLLARRTERLEEVVAAIQDAGGTGLAIQADVTDAGEVANAVARTASEFGRLDTIVNNAGIMHLGPAADAPPHEWDQMVDINVWGVLHVTRAALPHLMRAAEQEPRRVADIIMISSTAGRVARPGGAVYSLTKFGIAAFAESLRQEVLKQRIRVSVVEPGAVDTELVTHVRDEIRTGAQNMLQSIVALQPDDIADAVSYIVTRDRRVAVNELLVRSAEQTW